MKTLFSTIWLLVLLFSALQGFGTDQEPEFTYKSQDEKIKILGSSADGTLIFFVRENIYCVWNKTENNCATYRLDGTFSIALLNPDKSQFLTAQEDKLYITNLSTGQSQRLAELSGGNLLSIHYDPTGACFLTLSEDNKARLWDAKRQELLRIFQDETGISSAIFSGDGKVLIATNDGKILGYKAANRQAVLLEQSAPPAIPGKSFWHSFKQHLPDSEMVARAIDVSIAAALMGITACHLVKAFQTTAELIIVIRPAS